MSISAIGTLVHFGTVKGSRHPAHTSPGCTKRHRPPIKCIRQLHVIRGDTVSTPLEAADRLTE